MLPQQTEKKTVLCSSFIQAWDAIDADLVAHSHTLPPPFPQYSQVCTQQHGRWGVSGCARSTQKCRPEISVTVLATS